MQQRSRWLRPVGLIAVLALGPGLVELAWLSIRQRQLDRRLEALTRERERLEHEHAQLTSDPVYVEGLIRTTFKYAKPNEYAVQLDPRASRDR